MFFGQNFNIAFSQHSFFEHTHVTLFFEYTMTKLRIIIIYADRDANVEVSTRQSFQVAPPDICWWKDYESQNLSPKTKSLQKSAHCFYSALYWWNSIVKEGFSYFSTPPPRIPRLVSLLYYRIFYFQYVYLQFLFLNIFQWKINR